MANANPKKLITFNKNIGNPWINKSTSLPGKNIAIPSISQIPKPIVKAGGAKAGGAKAGGAKAGVKQANGQAAAKADESLRKAAMLKLVSELYALNPQKSIVDSKVKYGASYIAAPTPMAQKGPSSTKAAATAKNSLKQPIASNNKELNSAKYAPKPTAAPNPFTTAKYVNDLLSSAKTNPVSNKYKFYDGPVSASKAKPLSDKNIVIPNISQIPAPIRQAIGAKAGTFVLPKAGGAKAGVKQANGQAAAKADESLRKAAMLKLVSELYSLNPQKSIADSKVKYGASYIAAPTPMGQKGPNSTKAAAAAKNSLKQPIVSNNKELISVKYAPKPIKSYNVPMPDTDIATRPSVLGKSIGTTAMPITNIQPNNYTGEGLNYGKQAPKAKYLDKEYKMDLEEQKKFLELEQQKAWYYENPKAAGINRASHLGKTRKQATPAYSYAEASALLDDINRELTNIKNAPYYDKLAKSIGKAEIIQEDPSFETYVAKGKAMENPAFQGMLKKAFGKQLPYVTDAEKDVFYAHQGAGNDQAAQQYADDLARALDHRETYEEKKAVYLQAQDNTMAGLGQNLGNSWGASAAVLPTTFAAIKNLFADEEDYTPVNPNSPWFRPAHMVNASEAGLVDKLDGELNKALVKAGLSAGRGLISGPFSGAGRDITHNLENGMSTEQAWANAVVDSLIDIGIGRLPLDDLFKVTKAGRRTPIDNLKNISQQAGIGGMKAVTGDALHKAVDELQGTGYSDYELAFLEYMNNGMTAEEAANQLRKDFRADIMKTLAGGFLSSAVSGSGKYLVDRMNSGLKR